MSIKNPSLKVFLQKNLPKAFGGYKFYDKYLSQLDDVSPQKAWTILHQVFVDEFVNKDSARKWTGVPYLNPRDCPCSPGVVILVKEKQNFEEYFTKAQVHAVMASMVTDFCRPVEPNQNPVLIPRQDDIMTRTNSDHQYRKVFQSKNTEIAVIITVGGVTVHTVEDQLKLDNTFIDLNNFKYTGYKWTSCFVITRVLTADMLKIEVTLNGDVFYEHTFEARVPICFHANKVHVIERARGYLKRMKPFNGKLPICIKRRRSVQGFLNAFIPSQTRLGKGVGDVPVTVPWREPTALRSYRPNFLPRPERPHQTDLVYYYTTDQELLEILYGKNSCRDTKRTSTERRHRNRPRDRRSEVAPARQDAHAVINQPFDEIHAIPSTDVSTVPSSASTESDTSVDDSNDATTDVASGASSNDTSDTGGEGSSAEASEPTSEDSSEGTSSYTSDGNTIKAESVLSGAPSDDNTIRDSE